MTLREFKVWGGKRKEKDSLYIWAKDADDAIGIARLTDQSICISQWTGNEKSIESLPSAQPATNCSEFPNNSDTISRQAAIDACLNGKCANVYDCADAIKALLSVDLDKVKQEFKQDVRAQMSSADLISRQAVIESIKRNAYRHTYLDQIIDIIKDFPSAQPERETGEWIPVTNGRGGFECSKCHDYAPSYKNGDDHLSRYCPNCGADMRGEQDEH